MGGKALKNTITKRIDPENYIRIKKHIKTKLELEGYVIEEIKEVPGKDSFGDLDLLYWSGLNSNQDIRHVIIKLFKPNELVVNCDVCSWDFEQFQIDLIKCTSLTQMAFAKFYFSYGDLGGIIGRICSSHGLKFGHEGLSAVLYENTLYPEKPFDIKNTTKQILLSDSPDQVCDFLGLNWTKYTQGFNNLTEIFEWITETKYFSPELFKTFNHEHFKRLSTRPMYIKFIEYIGINLNKIYRGFEFSNNEQLTAIKYFNAENLAEKVKSDLETKKIIHEKFNGNYLIARGYNGKETGKIISEFKNKVVQDFNISWEQWILDSDIELIQKVLDGIIEQCGFINQSI